MDRRDRLRDAVRSTIEGGLARVMGLVGPPPKKFKNILNGAESLEPLNKIVLIILYDKQIPPGTSREEALARARVIANWAQGYKWMVDLLIDLPKLSQQRLKGG